MPDEDEVRPPVPYRNAADDRPAARAAVSRAIGGAVLGVALTGVVGFFVFATTWSVHGGPRHLWVPAAGFAAAAVACGVGLGFAWPHRHRRSVAVGCLIGVLVACLIEGTCFYSP